MYGAAILFQGHPYIESATTLSNKIKPGAHNEKNALRVGASNDHTLD